MSDPLHTERRAAATGLIKRLLLIVVFAGVCGAGAAVFVSVMTAVEAERSRE
ncbi:hypothetical protein [Jannaschia aquimarina]|uniref:Uncharacterized protein n=1 Tax=Jannaschia aquimarina TaxID=935700 RepID=A0A0D1CNY1_9RHOB|nr:hypothetical protein [Jannaschia aquimarina]KIT16467.1 hypothetical protein jaqu_16950 [Jannaschia aquimarina]SNT07872.1 hypothetical protein SAMN05421775_105151 [Jannaschia aquimarina]